MIDVSSRVYRRVLRTGEKVAHGDQMGLDGGGWGQEPGA